MEIAEKKVVKSDYYYKNIQAIFEYGEATFGENAALSFFEELLNVTRNLDFYYLLHPECRHLETKLKNTAILFLVLTSSFTELHLQELRF